MLRRILLIALCIPSFAFAEQPKAVISGPTGGVAGDIIVLDATQSIGKFRKWMVAPKLQSGRQTIMEIEGGTRAIIASVPGQYNVTLIVSNEEGIDVIEYVVSIGGGPTPNPQPQPQPQPQPNPPPFNPEPTFPNSKYGFSKLTYMGAREIGNKDEARKLAVAYRGIASKIGAGGLSGQAAIFAELKQLTTDTLGSQARVDAWKPLLAVALAKQFQLLKDQGNPISDQLCNDAFVEIAVGMETYVARP